MFPAVVSGSAQERDRSKIPKKYTWNLADLYPSEAAWKTVKERVEAEIPSISDYQGKLLSSPATLADALDKMFGVTKELVRLSTYAGLLSDQDAREGGPQGMRQEMARLRSAFSSQSAYIAPEILRGSRQTLDQFSATEPRLEVYRFYLKEIVRGASHTLGESEEKILAGSGLLANAPSSIYTILANADFPYPTVTLSVGKSVRLDHAAYAEFRASSNREDRELVMSVFLNSLGAFSRTFGAIIDGEVQKLLFYSKVRNYPSGLEAALDGPNIPAAVYQRLIEGVNRNLPAFHRYLKLRQRMLGVDQLHYYDLYAPLVSSVNLQYTPEEAETNILAALAPPQ
jgi:oligoendopeptidase F